MVENMTYNMTDNQSQISEHNKFTKQKPKPEYVTINPRLGKYFWIPDVFIDQAKQVREPTFHVLPASLRVYRYNFQNLLRLDL